MLSSVALLALSIVLAMNLRTELMGEDDMGQITVEVETKPGLQLGIVEDILNQVEEVVSADPNVEDYPVSYTHLRPPCGARPKQPGHTFPCRLNCHKNRGICHDIH